MKEDTMVDRYFARPFYEIEPESGRNHCTGCGKHRNDPHGNGCAVAEVEHEVSGALDAASAGEVEIPRGDYRHLVACFLSVCDERDTLRTENGKLREALRQREWNRPCSGTYCLTCRRWDDEGHAPDCALVALLAPEPQTAPERAIPGGRP